MYFIFTLVEDCNLQEERIEILNNHPSSGPHNSANTDGETHQQAKMQDLSSLIAKRKV